MKKYIFLLLAAISSITASAAVNVVIDYATFYSEQSGPYIELYLNADGNSMSYRAVEGGLQAELEITYLFSQGEEVKAFSKFRLKTPLYDSSSVKQEIIDQKRLKIPNGTYTFEFIIRDLSNGLESGGKQENLVIDYPQQRMKFSDIFLGNSIEKVEASTATSKGGYEIMPNYAHFYNRDVNTLYFYGELYNANKMIGEEEPFLIEYYIIQQESQEIEGSYRSFLKQNSKPINNFLRSFNVSDLPSGNYELVVNAVSKENSVLSTKRVGFQKSNPLIVNFNPDEIQTTFVAQIDNRDRIEEYIRSLHPIATDREKEFIENQVAGTDLEFMQQFFLNFWMDRNAKDPAKAWDDYRIEVDKVNEMFGNNIDKGYQTDRGVIYLKYGPPSAINQAPYEPSSYPYEIWQYYQLGEWTNRKFVFYSPSLEMFDYQLLHSNVRGEINNYRWQVVLQSRGQNIRSLDVDQPDPSFGSQADDLFNNPR